jgi:hypothetical protein
VENSWVSGQQPAVHGKEANPEEGHVRLTVQPLFGRTEEVPLEAGGAGHGGADARMTEVLYGAPGQADPLGRRATHRDGVLSLLTGFAANRSSETGEPVRVVELLDVGWR